MSTESRKSNVLTPKSNSYDAQNDVPAYGQATEPPPSDVLNLEELHNRCLGNAQLVQRVLKKFQQRIPEELAEIEKALELGDMEQIAHVAHRLKGSSASVSAKGIQQAAARIEDSSRGGCLVDIPAHIERLRDEWERCSHVVVR